MKFYKLLTSTVCLFCSAVLLGFNASAEDFQWHGDALLRYENEDQYKTLPPRERIRLIAHLGVGYQLSGNAKFNLRLSTGVRNKQNIPAITLKRLNEQKMPPRNIYIDRLFMTFNLKGTQLFVGKVPWRFITQTDMFWDHHLNPLGFHVEHQMTADNKLIAAYLKPLDGDNSTVGAMQVLQFSQRFQWLDMQWHFAPWLVNYQGDNHALYAKKDTQRDNRLVRLSIKARKGKYQMGIDYGYSLADAQSDIDFNEQRRSLALALRFGGLKKPGDWLAQFRLLRVERYGVITEFAQNATTRFATSNFKGVDVRLRKKLTANWWLGTRFSHSESIFGPKERGNRFRIETQFKF